MRLIDADALCREIRKATVYHSAIPGNWWEGQTKELARDEIIGIIKAVPTQLTQLTMGTNFNNYAKGETT